MGNGKIFGYRRVSSADQNLDRQELGAVDYMYEEKLSGSSRNRPELEQLLRYVRDDDTVVVYSIDRLARSMVDLLNIVEEIKAKGASIRFIKENLEFSSDKENHYAELQFTMLAAFAQFERKLIKDRQREGIEKAKARGVYKGRPETVDKDEIYRLLTETDTSLKEIENIVGCSAKTILRVSKNRLGMTPTEYRTRRDLEREYSEKAESI